MGDLRVRRFQASMFALLLVAACGGGGGGEAGPGGGGGSAASVNNPMPLATGDRWLYRNSDGSYEQVAVESFRTVGTLQAAVVATTQLDPQNAARDETLLARSGDSILELPDTGDPVSVAIGNFAVLPLPLQLRASATLLDRTISNGYDFDEDGRPDAMVLRVDQEVLAIETVTVPAGTFAGAGKVRTVVQLSVTLSSTGLRVSTTTTVDEWYAPEVGLVRDSVVVVSGGSRTTSGRELMGYSVAGRRSDNQGPAVASLTPAAGSTARFVNNVVVDFDEPVDVSSVHAAGITVRNASGDVLPATFSQVTATRFNLSFDQPPPTGNYTVNIAATVADLWGNTRPASQLAWSVDRTGPSVVRSAPTAGAQDVALNTTLELEFDEALDPATVNSSSLQLRDRFRATVPTTVVLVNPRTVRMTPLQPLEPGASYFLWAGMLLHDAGGVGNDNTIELGFATVQGQFSFPTAVAGGLGRQLAVADFTGDGLADILDFPDSSTAALRVHARLATGGFGAPGLVALPDVARCGGVGLLRAMDVDGDGRLDVVVTRSATGCGIQALKKALDGSLSVMAEVDGGANFVLADVNGDGRIDIIASAAFEARVSVWLQTAPGAFGVETRYAAVENARGGLAVGDVNGDGRPDIVVTSGQFGIARALTILLQQSDGSFGPAQSRALAGGSGQTPLALADLNGDGRLDIVVQAPGSGGLWVFNQQADGNLAAPLALAATDTGADILVADFNGDGKPDIAATSDIGGGPRVFTQTPAGSFGLGQSYAGSSAGSGFGQMAAMDVNADGRLDIVLAGPNVLINLGAAVGSSQSLSSGRRALRATQAVRTSRIAAGR